MILTRIWVLNILHYLYIIYNYRVLNPAPGRPQLGHSLRELVAINFENTWSRPDADSLTSSYLYRYCDEITTPYADCAAMAFYGEQLACQRGNLTSNEEHCKASNLGTPTPTNIQVDVYAKDMLYLMVQIQYLDRWVISIPRIKLLNCYRKPSPNNID